MDETSPTARALLTLELVQARPGIGAEALGERLGVSERAARRYIAILREAGVPIESSRGPYGGYRIGRGLRLPPLMFTAAEALGLVMAVLESHGAAEDTDPVGSALGKLVRVLPEAVAGPVEAVRQVAARRTDPDPPEPETTAGLVRASDERRRVRIGYRGRDHDVDPWAVVVRHGRWYLLGWSHGVDARRVYRVDRITALVRLEDVFTPPAKLDPYGEVEEQLSQGWPFATEVEIDAPPAEVRGWLPRSLGRLEPLGSGTRLVGSTENLHWYAGNLTALRAPFRVAGGPELRTEVGRLGVALAAAVGGPGVRPAPAAPGPGR